MSEHVCDYFEIENILIWWLLTQKLADKIQPKLLFVQQISVIFFFGCHLLKQDWIQNHDCSRLKYRKREYPEFSKSNNSNFVYFDRFKCSKHNFLTFQTTHWKDNGITLFYLNQIFSSFCILIFEFQKMNYDLIVMNLLAAVSR